MADESREIAATFRLKVDKSGFQAAETSIDGLKQKLGPTSSGKTSGDSVSAILDGLEKKFAVTGKAKLKTDEYGSAFESLKKRYAGLSQIGQELAKANKKPDDSILDSIIPGLNPKKTAAAGIALDGLKGHHAGIKKELEELFKEGAGSFGEMGEKVTGLVEKLGKSGLGGALASVAAGAAVAVAATAGLIELAHASAEVADKAEKMAQKSGVTTEEWQRLAWAGKLADVEAQELKSALQQVATTFEDARKGGAEDIKTLRALGLTWRDLKGQSPAQMLETISDRMMKLPPTERIAVAKKIGKSWADLIPLLTAGGKGLKEAAHEAEQFNLVMGEEQIKQSVEFVDGWKKVQAIGEGFRNMLAKELVPILEHTVIAIVDWYKANKQIVDQRVQMTVEGIAKAFKFAYYSLQPLIATLELAAAPLLTIVDLVEDIWVWAKGGDSLLGDAFDFLSEKLKEWVDQVQTKLDTLIPVDKWLDDVDRFIQSALDMLGPLAGPLGVAVGRAGFSATGVAGGVAGSAAGAVTGGGWKDRLLNFAGGIYGLPSALAGMGGPAGPQAVASYAPGETPPSLAYPSIPVPSIPAGPQSLPPGDVNVDVKQNVTINGATDENKVRKIVEEANMSMWREVEASVP